MFMLSMNIQVQRQIRVGLLLGLSFPCMHVIINGLHTDIQRRSLFSLYAGESLHCFACMNGLIQ